MRFLFVFLCGLMLTACDSANAQQAVLGKGSDSIGVPESPELRNVNAGHPIVHITKSNASTFAIDGGINAANRQDVYLWDGRENNLNQQWYEIDRGNGYYSYQKVNTAHCIDGDGGGGNRQNVYLWTCGENNYNQHWRKVSVDGYYRLEKRNAPGFSLDGNKGGANGQSVYLWQSNDSERNQLWSIEELGVSSVASTAPAPVAPPVVPPAAPPVATGNSNCTGDLQTCIDRMAANGGGQVVLGAGTFELTRSITPRSNVDIVGQGEDTIITWARSVADRINEPMIFKSRSGSGIENVEIRNLTFRCTVNTNNNNDRNRTAHMALFIDGVGSQFDARSLQNENITLQDLQISRCGGTAVHIKGTDGVVVNRIDIDDSGWNNSDLHHNIYFLRVRDIEIRNSVFTNSPSGHGVRMGSIDDAFFENLTVSGNADHGVHMTSATNVRGLNVDSLRNCAAPRGTCRDVACYVNCDFDFD